MPKMRNISQRQFVIAGKTLKQGETETFAQQVIDRHLAQYAGELEQVFDGIEEKTVEKVDVNFPVDEDIAESATTETELGSQEEPVKKKRGRKPKNA